MSGVTLVILTRFYLVGILDMNRDGRDDGSGWLWWLSPVIASPLGCVDGAETSLPILLVLEVYVTECHSQQECCSSSFDSQSSRLECSQSVVRWSFPSLPCLLSLTFQFCPPTQTALHDFVAWPSWPVLHVFAAWPMTATSSAQLQSPACSSRLPISARMAHPSFPVHSAWLSTPARLGWPCLPPVCPTSHHLCIQPSQDSCPLIST